MLEFTTIITPKTRKIEVIITHDVEITKEGLRKGWHEVGELVRRRTKQLIQSPPKTGRSYRINGAKHQASAPGEAPANLSGNLVVNLYYSTTNWAEMRVGDTAPYASFLERGRAKLKPRHYLIRAITEEQQNTSNILKRYSEMEKKL